MTSKAVILQITQPPVETPRSDYDPSKQVIIGTLHRHRVEQKIAAEGSLNLSKTCVV